MNSSVPSLNSYTISLADVNEVGNMYIISIENGKYFKISESLKLLIEEINGINTY